MVVNSLQKILDLTIKLYNKKCDNIRINLRLIRQNKIASRNRPHKGANIRDSIKNQMK